VGSAMGADRMGVLDVLRRLLTRPNGGIHPAASTRLADELRAQRERDRRKAADLERRVTALERYEADGEMRFGSGE
jgi:hypothetical protein